MSPHVSVEDYDSGSDLDCTVDDLLYGPKPAPVRDLRPAPLNIRKANTAFAQPSITQALPDEPAISPMTDEDHETHESLTLSRQRISPLPVRAIQRGDTPLVSPLSLSEHPSLESLSSWCPTPTSKFTRKERGAYLKATNWPASFSPSPPPLPRKNDRRPDSHAFKSPGYFVPESSSSKRHIDEPKPISPGYVAASNGTDERYGDNSATDSQEQGWLRRHYTVISQYLDRPGKPTEGKQAGTNPIVEPYPTTSPAVQEARHFLGKYYKNKGRAAEWPGRDPTGQEVWKRWLRPHAELPSDFFLPGIDEERQKNFEVAWRRLHNKIPDEFTFDEPSCRAFMQKNPHHAMDHPHFLRKGVKWNAKGEYRPLPDAATVTAKREQKMDTAYEERERLQEEQKVERERLKLEEEKREEHDRVAKVILAANKRFLELRRRNEGDAQTASTNQGGLMRRVSRIGRKKK